MRDPLHDAADADADSEAGPLVVTLASADEALRGAWDRVDAPDGFHLEAASAVSPAPLVSGEAVLAVVDAAAFADPDAAEGWGPHLARCVVAGSAEALAALGRARLAEAYDLLALPTTAPVLACRVADWARNIRRTGALEDLGRRAEELAERNDRLASRLEGIQTETEVLERQSRRLAAALERIRHVARLSREINSLDLDRIVRVATADVPDLVGARRASLYLYDAAADRLVLQGHNHGYPIADRIDLADAPRSPMALAVRGGELLLVGTFTDLERQSDVVVEREFATRYDTGSCAIVPLKGGARVRGVLNLADKASGEPFDRDIDLPVLEQIAELLGASIWNVELYREAERRAKTDPLTDLANRRAIEEALEREIDRSRRYGSPLSCLMFDVDGLKKVNDAHGHDAGDAVLVHLARVLVATVRSVDVPGRWAGDEFLVVLPDTVGSQAKRLARRLMAALREKPVRIDDACVDARISIGLAQYVKDEALADLLRRVDQAMYAAKHEGRDRISVA